MAKFIDPFCTQCKVRKTSCFKHLAKPDLDFLNANKISSFYQKGQNVFYSGRTPTGIYCLLNGKIKLSKLGADGKEQIVRFVLPGQLVGIRALLTDRSYRAFATTLEDSTVCFIDKGSFMAIIEKYPDITSCLLTTLGQLLEEAEEKMTSLAQKPVRERLAESLLILNKVFKNENCQVNNTTISLSREDLANIVGTATETVIRLLSEFREEKLIIIAGRKITLVNEEKLIQIARY